LCTTAPQVTRWDDLLPDQAKRLPDVRRRLIEARALARVAARRQPPVAELPAAHAQFWAAVRVLPKRQAQAVALYYLEDLPVAEIAATLGAAEGTVRASLHKARAALARRLDLGGEEQR